MTSTRVKIDLWNVDQVDEVGHAGRESEVVEANEAHVHNIRLALETATVTVKKKWIK